MDDRLEVIDAFVDGERVDAEALKRALSDAQGRDYFVDAWLLREGIHDEVAREPVPQIPWRAQGRQRWPLLAVAASVLCLIGGGLAGYQLAHRGRPAADARPVAEAPPIAGAPTSFPVPPATRTIPVEFSPATPGASGGN